MKLECLANFIQDNYDKIQNNPEELSQQAITNFNLENIEENLVKFFNDISNNKEYNCMEYLSTKNNPRISILDLGIIQHNPEYKTLSPVCQNKNCNGVGLWNLDICPYCHCKIPNLKELYAFALNQKNLIFNKKLVVTSNTTGEVIIRDDDVLVTDRDMAEVKRNIHKYIP